jgi:hypothetical protein
LLNFDVDAVSERLEAEVLGVKLKLEFDLKLEFELEFAMSLALTFVSDIDGIIMITFVL